MIAAAQQLEVTINDQVHLMSLYELGGQKYATFTTEDPSSGLWVPIPPPAILTQNSDTFELFKIELIDQDIVYRDMCTGVQ